MAMWNQLVIFTLDAQLYALPLASVQRVLHMVEVTPLPNAPEVVLGVIDLHGNIIPVMSMLLLGLVGWDALQSWRELDRRGIVWFCTGIDALPAWKSHEILLDVQQLNTTNTIPDDEQ